MLSWNFITPYDVSVVQIRKMFPLSTAQLMAKSQKTSQETVNAHVE